MSLQIYPEAAYFSLKNDCFYCFVVVVLCTSVSSMQGMAAACGALATLASLFKLSKRENVMEHAHSVLQSLKACNCLSSRNTLLRKLGIKLAQASGITGVHVCTCVIFY